MQPHSQAFPASSDHLQKLEAARAENEAKYNQYIGIVLFRGIQILL